MEEKEDLRKRIYSCLDRMGRYHLGILGVIGIYSLIAGSSNTVGVFYTFTPEYYCESVLDGQNTIQWNDCGSEDSSTNCTFDLDEKYNSIVTEFQLICSERYLAALSNTIYFTGVMIGALVFGPLADFIGRRRTLQITTLGHLLIGVCIHFETLTPNIAAFTGLRFVQGCFNQGIQSIAYTTLVEFTPMKYRTFMGCIWEGFWAIGLIYVGSLSKISYEWRTLQLFLIIPTAIGGLIACIIPESLHWQWTQNRLSAAITNYTKIAKRNGDKDFQVAEREFQRDKNWEKIETECRRLDKTSDAKVGTLSQMSVAFRNRILRKHILITSLLWFTVTMCYYAITFFLPNLAGDRHTNFIIGAGVEVVSFVVSYVALQKFGRANVIGIFMISNALLCIGYGVTELVGSKGEEGYYWHCNSSTCKGVSMGGICGMYIFTGELFPTICRGTMFGICGFCSRVGSLIAPQIVVATELVNPSMPMFLLGGCLIVSGGFVFLLPETLRIQIPNTMRDVEELWGAKEKDKGENQVIR